MYTSASNTYDYTSLNPTTGISKAGQLEEQQDRFLTLLVKQLQTQDPLNPMENAEMTSQMAQINSATGIERLNETMKQLFSTFSASQGLQAASLIGKSAMAPQTTFDYDGTTNLKAEVAVPGNVSQVAVVVVDKSGKVVDQMAGTIDPGTNMPFEWTGMLTDGTKAPAGEYHILARGLDGDGKEVELTVRGWQKVESVAFANGSVDVLLAGGNRVAFSDVSQVM
ncbi:flagellar hook assembly protein FlgD [Chitinibacteraceae bacterium HSL-7]